MSNEKFLLFWANRKKLGLFILKRRKGRLISNKGRDSFKVKLQGAILNKLYKNRKPPVSWFKFKQKVDF